MNHQNINMLAQACQVYPPPGFAHTANMLARNKLPFPPGSTFYTTKYVRTIPMHPPRLRVHPDILRGRLTPLFTSESPIVSNTVHQFELQHLPGLPLTSKIVQRVEQVGPTEVSYFGSGSPGFPLPEVSSPQEEEAQRRTAGIVQFLFDDPESQQASYASQASKESHRSSSINGHQLGDEHKLNEVNMIELQNNFTPHGTPDIDPWDLPNNSISYPCLKMPFNRRYDQEYAEEDPECLRTITPEEALSFGSWTSTWTSFNHRIKSWMVHQDGDRIQNVTEEVWENTDEEIFPQYKHGHPLFLEDTKDAVQPWDSGSWSMERAEDYLREHEEFKEWLKSRNKEYLEDEDDWVPGKPDLEMARVLKEGW